MVFALGDGLCTLRISQDGSHRWIKPRSGLVHPPRKGASGEYPAGFIRHRTFDLVQEWIFSTKSLERSSRKRKQFVPMRLPRCKVVARPHFLYPVASRYNWSATLSKVIPLSELYHEGGAGRCRKPTKSQTNSLKKRTCTPNRNGTR